jgi:CDP-diacylglycerol--glycerol-3-phosphate 3-phosphatidyltransferase
MTWSGSARDLYFLLGFLAFFLGPFAVHVARVWLGAVQLPPARAQGAGARLFGPLFVTYYYWLMRPVFRAVARTGLTPNQITLLTLAVAGAGAAAIATGHFALASVLVIGGGTLDIVDGHLARTKNMATSAGAFLDSTVDRVSDGLAFGGCVVYYADTPMMIVALAVLVLSFTVSYARTRGESFGVTGSEGLMQRADRLAVLGMALAFSPIVAHHTEGFVAHPLYAVTAGSLCLLALLNGVTACKRIVWTVRELRARAPELAPVGPAAASPPMRLERRAPAPRTNGTSPGGRTLRIGR